MAKLLNVKATQKRVEARTAQIKIGGTYFLSVFYDDAGAMVKVLDKSTKQNSAGWNSSVTVEVIEFVGTFSESTMNFYKPGSKHTVNASNLYDKREHADPQVKFQRRMKGLVG